MIIIAELCLRDLINRLSNYPFKPFRVYLSDGTKVDVVQSFLVSVGATSAVLLAATREDEDGHPVALRWQTVALLHMMRSTELNEFRPHGRKRSK